MQEVLRMPQTWYSKPNREAQVNKKQALLLVPRTLNIPLQYWQSLRAASSMSKIGTIFWEPKVCKPLLAVSGVIHEGNLVVFHCSWSFILTGKCAVTVPVRKAFALTYKKCSVRHANVGTRGSSHRWVSVGAVFFERAELQTERAWTTRKTFDRGSVGTTWWREHFNLGGGGQAEACGSAWSATRILKEMDDASGGREVAQRDTSDVGSFSSCEAEERRHRRIGRLNTTCFKGKLVSRHGVLLEWGGEVEPRDTVVMTTGVRTVLKLQFCHGFVLPSSSVETVQSWWCAKEWPMPMFSHLILAIRSWFPRITKHLASLEVPQSRVSVWQLAIQSCTTHGLETGLISWGITGNICSPLVLRKLGKHHQINQASSRVGCRCWSARRLWPTLTWAVPCAASMHRRCAVGRAGKTAYERSVGEARKFFTWHRERQRVGTKRLSRHWQQKWDQDTRVATTCGSQCYRTSDGTPSVATAA